MTNNNNHSNNNSSVVSLTDHQHKRQQQGIEHANDNLIDALLDHHYEADEVINKQIDKVMAKLNAREQTSEKTASSAVRSSLFSFLPANKTWFSIAASTLTFMIGLSLFVLTPSNPAIAAMDKAIEIIESLGDRSYYVEVTPIRASNGKRPPRDKSNKRKFEQAELYLRDHNQYVFRAITPKGYRMFKGSNGKQSWVIKPHQGVEIREGGKAVKLPLASKAEKIAFMDIGASLRTLKADYDISLIKTTVQENSSNHWSKIVMTKKDSSIKGPKEIAIYADLNANLIKTIIFTKVHLRGLAEPMRVSLDLTSSAKLPDNWFEASYHTNQ